LSTISFFIRPLKGNRRSTNSLALSSGKVKIPEHIAYICDGNGRWGIENNLTRADGHRVGANRTVEIVKSSFELGSRVVTLYLFSTENWSRPIDEIMYIFNLLESHLMSFSQYLYDNKVRIKVIGQVEKLPQTLQNLIKTFNKEAINDNDYEKTLILAISYGLLIHITSLHLLTYLLTYLQYQM
jgi:undecaprenyl diphosphate synthase